MQSPNKSECCKEQILLVVTPQFFNLSNKVFRRDTYETPKLLDWLFRFMDRNFNLSNGVSQTEQNTLQRLLLPKSLGGLESSLIDYSTAVRSASRYNGSIGWRLMIGATLNGAVAAFASTEAVNKIFKGRSPLSESVIIAGQTSPRAKVVMQGETLQLSGTFKFGSGLKEASWVLCGFIHPFSGEHTVAIIPKRKVRVQGGWNTFGLSDTDSMDYELEPVCVSPAFTFAHDSVKIERGSAIFCSGMVTVMLAGHIGFALGIAEQALQEITKLIYSDRRSGKLIGRDDFLIGYGREQAKLKSAIAFSEKAIKDIDQAVKSKTLRQEQKDDVRIAAIHSTEVARDTVRFVFDYGGMEATSNDSSLNTAFKDMHVASQHLLVNSSQYKPLVERMIEALNDRDRS